MNHDFFSTHFLLKFNKWPGLRILLGITLWFMLSFLVLPLFASFTRSLCRFYFVWWTEQELSVYYIALIRRIRSNRLQYHLIRLDFLHLILCLPVWLRAMCVRPTKFTQLNRVSDKCHDLRFAAASWAQRFLGWPSYPLPMCLSCAPYRNNIRNYYRNV